MTSATSLTLTAIIAAFTVVVRANHNPFGVIRIYRGNAPPLTPCVFPFEYKGKQYSKCTWIDHMRPWCATTSTYSRDKRWGNCLFNVNSTRAEIPTHGGNANRAKCAQPWFYQGVAYYGCINAYHNQFWCSTTRSYDQNKIWGNCDLDVAPAPTYTTGGNSRGKQCASVYFYKDRLYQDCIKRDYKKLWCAVTYDYRKEKAWGECLPSDTKVSNIRTWGGTAAGSNCTFPATYKGKTINECVTDDHMRLWCPTTNNYDVDQRWGNCIVPMETGKTYSGEKCVFPFEYEGFKYNECTTAMSNEGRPWCATVSKLARKSKAWGYCIPVVDTMGGNADGAQCYFPYHYKNKRYHTCIDRLNDGVLWCSTTPDYDLDGKWGNCVGSKSDVLAVGGSANFGETCVFPFKYKDEMYNQCIARDHNGNWCSTTINYDRDRRWGNCPY